MVNESEMIANMLTTSLETQYKVFIYISFNYLNLSKRPLKNKFELFFSISFVDEC